MKEIVEVVEKYIHAIHTQEKEDFIPLWTGEAEDTLISIGNEFRGVQEIYENFLIGGIQSHYESIDLIAEDISVRMINEDTAVVVFRYHTECIRRETKEEYGIAGLETQVLCRVDGTWKLRHVHYSKV